VVHAGLLDALDLFLQEGAVVRVELAAKVDDGVVLVGLDGDVHGL